MVLVCMPWAAVGRPALALGILKSLLSSRGVSAEVRSFHVAFAEHVVAQTANDERPLTLDDYTAIADETAHRGYGDWIFAVEPYRTNRRERDEAYFDLPRVQAARVPDLVRMRALVPGFLDACVADVLALEPRIVGFTTTFSQTVASLVLAQMLEQRRPDLAIVFGGASCEGPMGAALHRSFSCIDVVVRGEGEPVFPELVDDLLAGRPVRERPGLCLRRGDQLVHCPERAPSLAMDDVPLPDFDEFFDRLERSPLEAGLRDRVRMPYESARGCWWGAKHHCTFCGLNGAGMKFRSKSPARFVDDIRQLAERYQVLDYFVVDNIIDMDYFGTVLPALARSPWNLKLFFETKANLRLDQVRQLHEAGVTNIQPGIESLSTPILELMRKGVTAWQNIRLLKWCAAYRIDVSWNIIFGFPREPEDEYPRMAETMAALGHLSPPQRSQLRIDRFSPYFETPEAFGLRVTTPLPFYRHVYDLDPATLFDLAYHFRAEHVDGRDPRSYVAPLVEAIDRWQAQGVSGYRSLRYRRGPGFIIVDDRRPGLRAQRYEFDAVEAELYLACDAGETVSSLLAQRPDADLTEGDVRDFLDDLVASGLVYREGDRYLSLAIPDDPVELRRLEGRPRLAVVA